MHLRSELGNAMRWLPGSEILVNSGWVFIRCSKTWHVYIPSRSFPSPEAEDEFVRRGTTLSGRRNRVSGGSAAVSGRKSSRRPAGSVSRLAWPLLSSIAIGLAVAAWRRRGSAGPG